MLETYSQNVNVATNVAIPFNNVSIEKGCTATKTAPTTIALNKCGVYSIEFDATVAAQTTTGGTATVQMSKNNVLQSQALAQTSSTSTTDLKSISFNTLVQVNENNSDCCCASPTLIQFINTGIPATFVQCNVTVTKLC
jgi:hypothetical protein